VSEVRDDDYTSCAKIAHRLEDTIDAGKTHLFGDDLGRFLYPSLTHGEHGSELLALHTKASKEAQFIQKQHRFTKFTNDLVIWAIFWGPVGGESGQS